MTAPQSTAIWNVVSRLAFIHARRVPPIPQWYVGSSLKPGKFQTHGVPICFFCFLFSLETAILKLCGEWARVPRIPRRPTLPCIPTSLPCYIFFASIPPIVRGSPRPGVLPSSNRHWMRFPFRFRFDSLLPSGWKGMAFPIAREG